MVSVLRQLLTVRVFGGLLLVGALLLVGVANAAGPWGDVLAVIVVIGVVFAALVFMFFFWIQRLNEGTNTRTREASLDREVDEVLEGRDLED